MFVFQLDIPDGTLTHEVILSSVVQVVQSSCVTLPLAASRKDVATAIVQE